MQPTLLIASPQMKDPFFEKAVVLVWHHDENGAIGVIINRALEHTLPEVLDHDGALDLSGYQDNLVGWGGPVDTGTGTVITSGSLGDEDGWLLPNGLAVTRSHDALTRLLARNEPLLLCLGYAGWEAGQLDQEIADGSWLWTDADRALVFDVPSEDRYERALATLGLDSRIVWRQPIQE